MLIARGKKTENIAEYLLYMWHIEDQIRAFEFDIDRIKQQIIDAHEQPDSVKIEIRDWYESLIDMMKRENVMEKGHIQLNKNVINELEDLHENLMASSKEKQYKPVYNRALPLILELKATVENAELGTIETGLNFMYGLLMLKLQQKDISPDTRHAAAIISDYLRLLTLRYQQDKQGELDLFD
jgi:hypothetical protein